jgi:hypothetical protein
MAWFSCPLDQAFYPAIPLELRSGCPILGKDRKNKFTKFTLLNLQNKLVFGMVSPPVIMHG